MPKISAVMALYNTPYELLETTVKSILNQTFSDFELIIIDDASSMEYKTFFENFNDDRMKYFKLELNAGPGNARNEGMRRAVGEYIAIVDSDDVYMPNRFELQSAFLDKYTDISLLGGSFRASNSKRISYAIEEDKEIKLFLLFNSPFANPIVMFRKNTFIEKNLFYTEDKNFGEDYELWIDAMFAGIKMANLKDVLMVYTRRKNQLSKMKQASQELSLKQLYNKILSQMAIDASPAEIDLHYNIDCENYKYINSSIEIVTWFDKIIEQNKKCLIFDEELLINKKNEVLKSFNNCKNRLIKIKIGQNNFCISKNFKITFEKR